MNMFKRFLAMLTVVAMCATTMVSTAFAALKHRKKEIRQKNMQEEEDEIE